MKVIIRQVFLFLLACVAVLAVAENTEYDVKPAVKHYYSEAKASGQNVREELTSLINHYSNIADTALHEAFPPSTTHKEEVQIISGQSKE